MNKNCFLITSYCNTPKKESALLECVLNIKEMTLDADICVHAHYPLNFIQNQVNYYIYDSSNPVFKYPEKHLFFWRIHEKSKIKMSIVKDDYGYTALQQWKRGVDYLKRLGYDNVIILNYDVIITKKLAKNIIRELDRNDKFEGVLFYFKDNINMVLSAFSTRSNFLDSIDINEYSKNLGFAENYLDYKIEKSMLLFSKFTPEQYSSDFYSTMDVEGDKTFKSSGSEIVENNSPFDAFSLEKAKFHIGVKKDTDEFYLLVFNILEPINIEIFIEEKKSGFISSTSCTKRIEYLFYEFAITYGDFLSNEYEINIEIDGKKISQSTIDLFKSHSEFEIL